MLESTLHAQPGQSHGAATQACLWLNAHGEIRVCNLQAEELLGGNGHDLRGQPVAALIPALPLQPHRTGYNLAYVGLWYANGARRRLLGIKHDGRALPLDIAVNVVQVGNSPSYLVRIEPAAAGSRLDQGMGELQQSLAGRPESAMITNREGIIEYVNAAFETRTGFTRDEAVGRTSAILRSPTHGREFYATLSKSLMAGLHYHGLFVVRKKDGTIFHANLMMWPFADSSGTATHFVALGTDAGERIAAARRVIEVEMLRAPAATPTRTREKSGVNT